MPVFFYEARDHSGEKISAHIESQDKKSAIEKLTQNGYCVTKIAPFSKASLITNRLFLRRRVKTEALVLFNRQVATMLRSGITLLSGLQILIKQSEDKRLRAALVSIKNDISGGSGLADAFSKYPEIFSNIYINTIRVGEETGNLEEILDRIASFTEWQTDFEARIKASLLYPAVVIVIAMGVIIFLLTFVLPRFATVFSRAGVPLPFITQAMLTIGNFLLKWWYIHLTVTVMSIFGITIFSRTAKGRFFFDHYKLKIPIIKTLVSKVVILRFCRSLEIMLRNGVGIVKSLEIVAHGLGNVVVEQVLNDVRLNVHKGGTIAEVLKQSEYFPPMVVAMIAVGEESGSLDKMLADVAVNYERQIDYISRNFTTMFEPVLLIILSVVVGAIASSLFLPIFKFIKVLR